MAVRVATYGFRRRGSRSRAPKYLGWGGTGGYVSFGVVNGHRLDAARLELGGIERNGVQPDERGNAERADGIQQEQGLQRDG